MKIGILGAGMIGATAARLLANVGYDVAISNSRDPETLAPLIAELGPHGRAGRGPDVAQWADLVLLAVPWRVPEALPPPETVRGKIVIDAMNPYTDDGGIANLGASTSSEETQKRLPGARIVKAFNTIRYRHLAERGRPDLPVEERHAIFIAGDDAAAKQTVVSLIESIGFGAVDTGSLAEGGRRQQPNTPLYNKVMTVSDARAAAAHST